MSISDVQQNWETFARTDPLWSILSEDSARGNRWDVDAFFATGRAEIDALLADLDRRAVTLPRRRAVDFGCGVGRLSQALARHFDEVVGVDISPTMIELACGYDTSGRCRFLVNASTALTGVPPATVDLVYTNIVLQHNEVPAIEAYLRSLARLVAPGGVFAFQLPSERASVVKRLLIPLLPLRLLRLWRRRFWKGGPEMLMNGLPRDRVVDLVEQEGLTLVDAVPDASAGSNWRGYRYIFRRPA
jgi:SAM-dependent methyltransferase